jgi:uncharacterized membrane protein
LPLILALYAKGESRMDINATLLGEIIFISVIVIGVLSYYLGKRKTNTPKMATFIGMLLAFIPPLGLIYIAILVLKNDINQNNTGEGVE